MNHADLQAEILSCIPSHTLLEGIVQNGHVFSDRELLAIAFQYARSQEERLSLLALIAQHAEDRVAKRAKMCIEWQKRVLEAFCAPEPDAVFELHIKEKPDAFEERYLCADYETALRTIDGFYVRYCDEETAQARYWIEKRRILKEEEAFAEDSLGMCRLLPGKVLADVDIYCEALTRFCVFCDEIDQERCGYACMYAPIGFPGIFRKGELVQTTEWSGKQWIGVYLGEDFEGGEDVYVIPLDSPRIRARDFEEFYMTHRHVEPPLAERLDRFDLSEDMRADYDALLTYLGEMGSCGRAPS